MPDFTETKEPKTQPTQKTNIVTTGNSASVWVFFIMFGIFTAIFLGLSSAAKWEGVCVTPLFIIYMAFIVATISAYNKQTAKIEKTATEANALQQTREMYLNLRKQVDIPDTAKEVTYFKSSTNSPIKLSNSRNGFYIWKSENKICFFPCNPNNADSISIVHVKISSIPISQIEHFSQSGEIFRENKITGGGGGGSSIGGAVVGGLVAGEVGAVIGSRKKVNEIKSELVTHDTRETILNYFYNDERHTLFFDFNAHRLFNDLIPEKELGIVSAIKSSEIIKSQIADNQKSISDQLRELAKLRDEGIITESEFNEKKKQLLDKIS